MNDELYEIEVDGERLDDGQKLIVQRARLVSRIDSWPEVAGQLADDCMWSIRDRAVRELELATRPEASELSGFEDIREAAAYATTVMATRRDEVPPIALTFLGFLSDAVEYATEAASTSRGATYAGHIAAYSADWATTDDQHRLAPGSSPFRIERQRQAAFLLERLRPSSVH